MDLQDFQLEIVWPKIHPTKSIIATLMTKIAVAQIRNYLGANPTCICHTKLVNAREKREFLLVIMDIVMNMIKAHHMNKMKAMAVTITKTTKNINKYNNK